RPPRTTALSRGLLAGAGLGAGGGVWPSATVFGNGDCSTALAVVTPDGVGRGGGAVGVEGGGGVGPRAAVVGNGDCSTAVAVVTPDGVGTGDAEVEAFVDRGSGPAAGLGTASSGAVLGAKASP